MDADFNRSHLSFKPFTPIKQITCSCIALNPPKYKPMPFYNLHINSPHSCSSSRFFTPSVSCVVLENFLAYPICHRQIDDPSDPECDSSGCPSWSLHTKPLWPAPTPRQATGGMLRLVFSQRSQAEGCSGLKYDQAPV